MNRAHPVFVALFVLCLLGSTSMVNAQDGFERKLGMTVSIQTGQSGLSFPYWISQRVVLTPSIAFTDLTDDGTSLNLGVALRINLTKAPSVPYVGFRLGKEFYYPERVNAETEKRNVLGLMMGGEHFLDEHFSLGVEFQANMLKWTQQVSYREGDQDMTLINTGAAALATFYF